MRDLGCPKSTVGQCVSRVWNVCLGRCGPDGGSPWGETDQAWDEGGRGQWVRVLCCGQWQGSVFREAGEGRETEPSGSAEGPSPARSSSRLARVPPQGDTRPPETQFQMPRGGGICCWHLPASSQEHCYILHSAQDGTATPSPQKKDRSSLRHHSCAKTRPEIITLREMGKWKECLWTNKWNWDVNQWSGYENNKLVVPRGRGKVVFKVELW